MTTPTQPRPDRKSSVLTLPMVLARGLWRTRLKRNYGKRREQICAKHLRHYGGRVLQGPFAGMSYLERSHNSEFLPKLLGSYECELASVIEEVIRRRPSTIVDVGCAEGYYAVGLALRCGAATVHAFDADPLAHQACEQMARQNGVADRVVIRGACSPTELNGLSLTGAFLLSDCEGCEYHLLSPEAVPGLTQCDILVELHDYINERITTELVRRFSSTHDIRLIASINRDPNLYPALWYLPNVQDRKIALDEQRLPMNWAYLTVRGGPAL